MQDPIKEQTDCARSRIHCITFPMGKLKSDTMPFGYVHIAHNFKYRGADVYTVSIHNGQSKESSVFVFDNLKDAVLSIKGLFQSICESMLDIREHWRQYQGIEMEFPKIDEYQYDFGGKSVKYKIFTSVVTSYAYVMMGGDMEVDHLSTKIQIGDFVMHAPTDYNQHWHRETLEECICLHEESLCVWGFDKFL